MKRVIRGFLVVAIAASLISGAASAASTAPTPSWFAGVWQTSFGVMKIKQTGAAVTGRYGSAQTYTITGTVSGRTLRGTWTQAGSSGKFFFTISTDGSSFKGDYGTGAEPPTSAWTGTITSHAKQQAAGAATTTTSTTKVALKPSNFAGVWKTSFGVMKIKQTGAAVTGRYGSAQTYTITGTVSGRTLRGTWTQAGSSGKFFFTISTDNSSSRATTAPVQNRRRAPGPGQRRRERGAGRPPGGQVAPMAQPEVVADEAELRPPPRSESVGDDGSLCVGQAAGRGRVYGRWG